jgi:hypothetical protein
MLAKIAALEGSYVSCLEIGGSAMIKILLFLLESQSHDTILPVKALLLPKNGSLTGLGPNLDGT